MVCRFLSCHLWSDEILSPVLEFIFCVYSTFKVRRGGRKEITLVQGKEQWLRFARAAVKRYLHVQGKRNPSKTVGVPRGYQRADTWKP